MCLTGIHDLPKETKMEAPRNNQMVYLVVDVVGGVAVDAFAFAQPTEAQACLQQLREGRNLDEDDVQLFQTRLGEFRKMSDL